MYKKFLLIFILTISIIFTGCNSEKQHNDKYNDISKSSISNVNDPKKALDEIYKNVNIKGVEDGDKKFITDILNIDKSYFKKYYIKKTDGKFGVADIYIIEPTQGNSDKIIKAFTAFRDQRALQFKDYNI